MLLFEIPVAPVPQKQTRFGNGKAYDPSAPDKHQIQWNLRPYAPDKPLKGPIEVDITFYMPIPKNTSSLMRKQMINNVLHHMKRPDVDNLSYLVVNAMKDIIYEDDSQIVDLNLHKRYGEQPKTVVKVIVL